MSELVFISLIYGDFLLPIVINWLHSAMVNSAKYCNAHNLIIYQLKMYLFEQTVLYNFIKCRSYSYNLKISINHSWKLNQGAFSKTDTGTYPEQNSQCWDGNILSKPSCKSTTVSKRERSNILYSISIGTSI